MKQQYGPLSRSITALSLAIGLSFGGAATIGAQTDDGNLDVETAYLYQGNTSNFDAATMVTQIDDLDDDDRDDDNADDINETNDDWDDDDVYESNDDWDDDDDDDVYESDDDWDDDDDGDDDWDDFLGKPLNLQSTGNDHWEVLGNGQERPAGLISAEDELDDDLNLTVQTLADGDYMIVVHANGSTDSPVIAAGNIEGDIVDGSILVELDEVEASGYEGRAYLEPEDDDDINEIEITVGVYPTGTVQSLAEPVPTPRG